MKRVGNFLVKEASLRYNSLLAKFSLVAYSLYKTFSKTHFKETRDWKKLENTISNKMRKVVFFVEKEKLKEAEPLVDLILKKIEDYDRGVSRFQQSVVDSARIKMAAKAIGLGLSLKAAASLFGANEIWLQEYRGEAKDTSFGREKKSINDRLRYLE